MHSKIYFYNYYYQQIQQLCDIIEKSFYLCYPSMQNILHKCGKPLTKPLLCPVKSTKGQPKPPVGHFMGHTGQHGTPT